MPFQKRRATAVGNGRKARLKVRRIRREERENREQDSTEGNAERRAPENEVGAEFLRQREQCRRAVQDDGSAAESR